MQSMTTLLPNELNPYAIINSFDAKLQSIRLGSYKDAVRWLTKTSNLRLS